MKSILNKLIQISIIFIFFIIFFITSPKVFASTGDNVFGYAWSDNIGWISFNNCDNPTDNTTCVGFSYGVSVDTTTNIVSGYAWSDNIGWISFNPTDWGVCPPNNSSCNLSNFQNKWNGLSNEGWGRTLSALNGNSGGWDGWISLNGTKFSSTDISNDIISGNFSGFSSFNSKGIYGLPTSSYAWGSDVVGWIDLNYDPSFNPNKGGVFIFTDKITVELTASKSFIISGDTVDFSWTSTNFTPVSCEGKTNGTLNDSFGDWKKSLGTSGSVSGINVKYDPNNIQNTPVEFILSCVDSNSVEKTDSVIVTTVPIDLGLTHSYTPCYLPSNTFDPELTWSTDSTNINSCSLNAINKNKSYTVSSPINLNSSTIIDDQFAKIETAYQLACKAGGNNYQTSEITALANTTIKVCVPDYNITSSDSCNGVSGIGKEFQYDGTKYSASINLEVNPLYGFNSDILISKTNSLIGTGTFSFDPTNAIFSGATGIVKATLILTKQEYNDVKNGPAIANDPRPEGVFEMIEITSSSGGIFKNPININFCDGTGVSVKPKYKPF